MENDALVNINGEARPEEIVVAVQRQVERNILRSQHRQHCIHLLAELVTFGILIALFVSKSKLIDEKMGEYQSQADAITAQVDEAIRQITALQDSLDLQTFLTRMQNLNASMIEFTETFKNISFFGSQLLGLNNTIEALEVSINDFQLQTRLELANITEELNELFNNIGSIKNTTEQLQSLASVNAVANTALVRYGGHFTLACGKDQVNPFTGAANCPTWAPAQYIVGRYAAGDGQPGCTAVLYACIGSV